MTIQPNLPLQAANQALLKTQSASVSILKNSMEQPQELMNKLLKVGVQQTIDAGKMETIGTIIDMVV